MDAISDLLAYIWKGITYFFTVIIPGYYNFFASFFLYINDTITYYVSYVSLSFWLLFNNFYMHVSLASLRLFGLLTITKILRSILPHMNGMLPLPNYSWGSLILRANDAFLYVAPYLRMLDYFVDLTLYIGVMVVLFLLEFALLGFRVWRTIRSLVT